MGQRRGGQGCRQGLAAQAGHTARKILPKAAQLRRPPQQAAWPAGGHSAALGAAAGMMVPPAVTPPARSPWPRSRHRLRALAPLAPAPDQNPSPRSAPLSPPAPPPVAAGRKDGVAEHRLPVCYTQAGSRHRTHALVSAPYMQELYKRRLVRIGKATAPAARPDGLLASNKWSTVPPSAVSTR